MKVKPETRGTVSAAAAAAAPLASAPAGPGSILALGAEWTEIWPRYMTLHKAYLAADGALMNGKGTPAEADLRAAYDRVNADSSAAWDRCIEIVDALADLPSGSLAELAAKARPILDEVDSLEMDEFAALGRSLAADVVRLAAGTAA